MLPERRCNEYQNLEAMMDGIPGSGVPKVALLIHSMEFGGAQRSVITSAAAWPSASRCRIISARGGALLDEARQSTKTTVMAESWPNPLGIARFMWSLRRTAKDEPLAAVLTNSFGMARVVLLLKKIGGLRTTAVIVVERNTLSAKTAGMFKTPLVRSAVIGLTRWLYRSADGIIGVSDGVSRDLEQTLGLPEGTVTTIYNGIETGRISAAVEEAVPEHLEAAFVSLPRPVVITIGRLVAAKAHRDLLDAFALLPETLRGSLVILGEGPLREELERQAQDLGIPDRIWMPGFVDNPWWFMTRSDAFALSSHWEGHPRVLLEALACGVPIVSTDCPSGPREILEDVSKARLTPVGDPEALAEAIVESLALPTGSAERSDMQRFAPLAVAERYHDAMSRIVL